MIEESKALCRAFKPCGPMTVQLILDKASIDWLIEINPRFGGGAPLSMKAGARSAEAVLHLLDCEDAGEYEIADGGVYSRFDQSVCITESNGSQIKGVIFDLDDTLYSEKEYVKSGFRGVAEHLGNEDYTNRLWSYFEVKKPAIDELLRELDRESEKAECLNIYRIHKPDIHLCDGVLGLLQELKSKGFKIGIITDGRPGALNLIPLVDDCIITDELGGSQFRKPCDIAFRILLTRWRLNPADTIYVGDNADKDFQAPQQLGIRSVWFRNEDGLYYGGSLNNEIESIKNITELMMY